MSRLAVEVVSITRIESHPNADKLEIAYADAMEWPIVVRKGEHVIGDRAVYFPIDSILPSELESYLFPPESKIKLEKSRIRTIKIRGAISQGMLVPCEEIETYLLCKNERSRFLDLGEDLTAQLGVKKYEPPPPSYQNRSFFKMVSPKIANPLFKKYTDIEHYKKYPHELIEGEEVLVTEKLHGTNFRAAVLPREPKSVWEKIRNFFGLLPKYEFVYGSRNVQLKSEKDKTFYPINLYWEAVQKYGLQKMLKPGEQIFGEIVGPGIQKGYDYALEERHLALFDVMVDGRYLNWDEFRSWDTQVIDRYFIFDPENTYSIPSVVPTLYVGEFQKEIINHYCVGESTYTHNLKREGIVIKPIKERRSSSLGRVILKAVNPEYLLEKEQSEFH